uniref:Uncharacterized protein n=1 Tax=Amphimedon queenslandica TaxID=400682 RepID=A0A1X7T8R9_AMPQE
EFMRLYEDDTHSCNKLDYIIGHFTGIFLVSTFWFAVYSLYMRNRPKVYPKVILPALISGIIWGIAMSESSWDCHVASLSLAGCFLANENLSLAASFPIITAGPGFISSVWGILLYREIK